MSILDDLFQWAAQQPSGNITTVQIAITTNRNNDNVVSYAEGGLQYFREHSSGWVLFPPTFTSEGYTVTQYFSNKRYPTPGGFAGSGPPFSANAGDTDSLTVSIRQGFLGTGDTITIKSKNFGTSESFTPNFDPLSGVISWGSYNGLLTISLCGKNSFAPPR